MDQDGDDNLVKQFAAPLDNVEMTIRYWVEGAGENGASH
jgi:hypothetical protein